MKIVTWNVNSLNARMDRVLEFLELHRPDLLLMQETKVDPDKFPDLAFAEAGYHAVHHSAGRWAGVAIAAPQSAVFEDVHAGLDGEPDVDEARWLPIEEALQVLSYRGEREMIERALSRLRPTR